MVRQRLVGVLCAVAAGAGGIACARPVFSNFRYRDPRAGAVVHQGVVDAPLETVWARILSRISQGFFRVTDMRHSTGFINVTFATDDPGVFVDCGSVSRVFGNRAEQKHVQYNPASSAKFEVADTWGPLNDLPVITEVQRKTRLEGNAYIYVAAQGPKTIVSVDAHYALSISVAATTVKYDAFGSRVAIEPVPARKETVNLTTTEAGGTHTGEGKSRETCRSSGALERGILNLAQP